MTILFPDPDQLPPHFSTLANGLTLAGLGLLVFGVITGANGADSSEQKLAALLLLVAASLAWVAWVLLRNSSPEAAVATCLVVVAAAGGALAAFSPVALVFPGVATLAAASRWTMVPAAAIAGAGALAVLVGTVANGNNFVVVYGGLAAVFTGLMVGLTRRQAIEHAAQLTRLELASDKAEVARSRAELLAERNHMARELHDVLAHTLAALSLQLEAFATVVDNEPETSLAVREQLERTSRLVREGLDEARGAVHTLRDDAEPLDQRLTRLAEQHHAAFVTAGAVFPLAPEATLALYRVAQEALTNVLKHARGATASVRLAFALGRVTLTIDNDLPDSDGATRPLGTSGGGFGLTGIGERVALLGGEVEVGPVSKGWRVIATVPVDEAVAFPAEGSAQPPGLVRVLVVDDQRVVREGLAIIVGGFPDAEVVGQAADGEEAIALVESETPDVVLMDLRMPRLDGVEATRAVRERYPNVQVVVLTTYADDESIVAALTAGAAGFITKDAARDDIRRALEAAVAGQAVLDPSVQTALLKAARQGVALPGSRTVPPDGLTEREVEVLALIASGLSNQEIAEQLYVAETTVKTHINRIFAKTGSRDRAQAAVYAHHHGLGRDSAAEHRTPAPD